MPAVSGPPQDALYSAIYGAQRRLDNLERTQGWGIRDSNDTLRVKAGLQSDGTFGIWFFDASGAVQLKLAGDGLTAGGVTVDGTGLRAGDVDLTSSGLTAGPVTINDNGLTVKDGSITRAQVGKLASGDYGVSVTDSSGSDALEVLPIYGPEYLSSDITTTATGYNNSLASVGPSVTALVGNSGQVMITVGAWMGNQGVATWTTGAAIGIALDGNNAAADFLSMQMTNGSYDGAEIGIQQSITRIWSGLSPGSHTFQMQYRSIAGKTAAFAGRSIVVQPIGS